MCLWKPFAPLALRLYLIPHSLPAPSIPHSPRLPSLHFYLTSSNYFRVIPASRRLKRHWETKPSAPPTDPCAAQSQPGKGLYVANCIAAAVASGSNRARRGCLLSEGRAAFITAQRSWNISQSLHEENGACVCSVVAIIKPYFRTALSLKVLILKICHNQRLCLQSASTENQLF